MTPGVYELHDDRHGWVPFEVHKLTESGRSMTARGVARLPTGETYTTDAVAGMSRGCWRRVRRLGWRARGTRRTA